MNVGFFGIQYSFGLQQSAVNPIYDFLGASPDEIPLLNLAGPITGLLVQPIVGALSDKTWHPKFGRRKPYFLLGAILCSLALLAFPFSSSLWMAAGLLWILDAGNNTAMEPYRAFIADKLKDQIIHFNKTYDYRFPTFSDPEGMPVYIYFSCIPGCNQFSYNINNEGIGFHPT
jgi:maltose/moltooligosaccharide transporter